MSVTVSRLSLSIMVQTGKVKSLLSRYVCACSQVNDENLWKDLSLPFEMTNPCELSSFRVLREAQHKLSEKSFSTGLLRSHNLVTKKRPRAESWRSRA
jgi:hypothetical protein